MSTAGVHEHLLEADRLVRQCTFAGEDLDHVTVLAAWPEFSHVAATLTRHLAPDEPAAPSRHVADLLDVDVHEDRTVGPRHPVVAEATQRLRQADYALTHRSRPPSTTGREELLASVLRITATAAHLTGTSTRAVAAGSRRPSTRQQLAHQENLQRLQRIEGAALTALSRDPSGQPPGRSPAEPVNRVADALTEWTAIVRRVLPAAPSVADLHAVAATAGALCAHTRSVAAACAMTGDLTPLQAAEADRALAGAGRAWADAAAQWPPFLIATKNTRAETDLVRAATRAHLGLAAMTHPGERWAAPAQVAAEPGLPRLLHALAHTHQDLAADIHLYDDACQRTARRPDLTVPASEAGAYADRVLTGGNYRVLVAARHRPWRGDIGSRLITAARSTASTLSTLTVLTPEAVNSRAWTTLSLHASRPLSGGPGVAVAAERSGAPQREHEASGFGL
ncbi:MAG TPA: hypothetical protein VES95_07080 [Dermatophilaceae bacterium]|nr:hypothetical protein [Dermatophilaceae bacterium]